MGRYLVGIDLGTTNSALAFVDLSARKGGAVKLQSFPIAQLVAAGEMGTKALLPSFLYLPAGPDLPTGATVLPWNPKATDIVGEFARTQGGRVPGRLVTSAKSWLCHAGVDRTSPLLPWAAPPEVPRLSPLDVSMRYLKHIVDAWNNAPGRSAADRLEEQEIVLTVPASFDDVARNLTAEAAKQAGMKHVTLLEEPQAAFYCWMGMNTADEVGRMKPGMRCLVVDVGGGTSDFSLILAAEDQGELTFVREAVGDHLLLGGDNMDMALARYIEAKIGGAKLDAVQFAQLVQACRGAKEVLLAPEPPKEVSITIMGRGRSVIGGSIHSTVTNDDIKKVLFDGFFPLTSLDSEPQKGARAGLQEMGLPYVSDPAVTRHLAQFLKRHLSAPNAPDTILFNGGVFQPQSLRDRLIDVLRPWYSGAGEWSPLVLANPSLDLAVAWGAAFFAWLKHSGGRRIGGGIPRSYYVGIEAGTPPSNGEQTVLCVVPRRLEEGQTVSMPSPILELGIGQPVLFPLFTSTARGDDKPGSVLNVSPTQLMQLPPLHTILRGGKRSTGPKTVPVTLEAKCTEIGTLELYCVAQDGSNRWRLEFNVRDIVKEAAATADDDEETSNENTVIDVWPEDKVQAAASVMRATYKEEAGAIIPAELTKAMEVALEGSRQDWPTGLCRRMSELLFDLADDRTRSPGHLNRWYNLIGFCLRPGFGDSLDRFRVEQLWKLLNAPPKTGTTPPREGGAEYWIMMRRIAGGLNGTLQQNLFSRVRPIIAPGKTKPLVKVGTNELAEMWRCAASLERLDTRSKELLGTTLLPMAQTSPVPPYVFWSLTRLGTRQLFYGPLNVVVHPQIVENWLDELVGFTPANDSENNQWSFCLAQLSRMTGQRALDIDEPHRKAVRMVLRPLSIPDVWRQMVEEVISTEGDEQSAMFGESLPIGLRLAGSGG